MDFRLDIGGYGITSKGCRKTTDKKLSVHDWMSDLPETEQETDFVEVQFKNTRKGYFLNSTKIPLEKGDMVAVEASPGHDIGEVTLTGRLVLLQMKRNNLDPAKMEIRRVYRKAKESDLEKYKEAKAREQETMIKARRIAEEMKLDMKIGDVEYQGDGNKAIFYYIANERVDFRQLIKVFAETFRVRIEMKQIGARQEAGRIGGIGPCGRELCCSKWMKNFCSVSTRQAEVLHELRGGCLRGSIEEDAFQGNQARNAGRHLLPLQDRRVQGTDFLLDRSQVWCQRGDHTGLAS